METLTIKSLQFRAYHGYYEKERSEGNDFEVDLNFRGALRKAGNSDNLQDTIDYQEVLNIVKSVMEGPSRKLIETLAKQIGDQLFDHFKEARELEVAVRKLNPPLEVETAYSEIKMQWPK